VIIAIGHTPPLPEIGVDCLVVAQISRHSADRSVPVPTRRRGLPKLAHRPYPARRDGTIAVRDIAKTFKGTPRGERLPKMLQTLVALGQAREIDGGRYTP
jgi:hypothetical protein